MKSRLLDAVGAWGLGVGVGGGRGAALRFQMDAESCEPTCREVREMWFSKWKWMTLAATLSPEGGGTGWGGRGL